MKKGIFWCKQFKSGTPELIIVSVPCDSSGAPLETVSFSGKSGNGFNHKSEWERLPKSVTGGAPFDMFPRGRVEVKRGNVTVFLNPDLCREAVIQRIINDFELQSNWASGSVRFVGDGSRHYRHRC